MRGNQYVFGNKLCAIHAADISENIFIEQIDMRPITRRLTTNIEEKLTGFGCKTETNLNKYSERTAGMFYILRPCGIRLSHYEMFTSESLSMVFKSFVDIFGENPSTSDLMTIVYDRSCDLHPYLKKLANNGNKIAENYLRLQYIVDIFHCEKHTMAKCNINHPECYYHPDLPIFQKIRSTNMEICEQTNHILNPFKHITRNMTYAKRLCFLKIIDDDYNRKLELKQKTKQF